MNFSSPFQHIIIIKSMSRKQTTINDFQNLQQIGHGGFGRVYRARHKVTGKQFALKKIPKKKIIDNKMLNQLSNQIKISKSLKHDNIVKLVDSFQDSDSFYMVLQLAHNGQLFQKLMKAGRFSQKVTKKMILDVIAALSYLHSQNPPIIHRDIKPENLLLDKNNKIMLSDFGWSNFLNRPRMTFCGTTDYLAPEMIDKSGHDEKLDIWCLGVLVFELLTGKTPFVHAENPNSPQSRKITEKNILQANIKFPEYFPPLAKDFILGMIKRKPEERMTLQQIKNHQWLKNADTNTVKQVKQVVQLNSQSQMSASINSTGIIQKLNKRIIQLQSQLSSLRLNERLHQTTTTQCNQVQMSDMKRKLKANDQRIIQLQSQNEQLREELLNREKQLIKSKSQLKKHEQENDIIEQYKLEKKKLQDKIKKLENKLEESYEKRQQLEDQMTDITGSLQLRAKNGKNIAMSEVATNQFADYIKNQLQELKKNFELSQEVLEKVMEKETFTEQKEEQLIKLRTERSNYKERIKAELKENFEAEKDAILMNTRRELTEQSEKWYKQRQQLKQLYEQNTGFSGETKISINRMDEIERQLRTIKQLNHYYQQTITEQSYKIKDLQEQLRRRK